MGFMQREGMGKLLEGAKIPQGSRRKCPLAGVQGVKPPEANTFLVFNCNRSTLRASWYFLVKYFKENLILITPKH